MIVYVDSFIKFESENNLFKKDINGFKYWHSIRKLVFDDLLDQKESIGEAHTSLAKQSYNKRVWLKMKQFRYWILKNPFIALKEKDILVFNHQRRVKNSGYYDCIYTDAILDKVNYSHYVFELPHLERHFTPVRTKNLRYLDYLTFKVAIQVELKRKILRIGLPEQTKVELENILECIDKVFEIKINRNKILRSLEIAYLSYKPSRSYYNKILNRTKPRLIIEVVSYGRNNLILNELAKEKGIPTIELQHGIMGNQHIAYNFAKKMDLPTFPDYIFAFGQYWKDNTRLPIDDDKVKIVGWPYYEQKLNKYKQKGISNDRDKKTILFISQGTIGEELSKIAVEFFRSFNNDEYRIIYKLHPGEYARWKDEYPWLIDSGIEVIDHNLQDMHYYFAQSDIQIGVGSTAIYEGLGYGLATIIIELYGHQVMATLYDELKIAYLAKNAEDVLCILKNIGSQMRDHDMSYFWMANSMDNVKHEINKIIEDER